MANSITGHLEEAQRGVSRALELAKLAESNLTDEIRTLLCDLYGDLFIQAAYDPDTESVQKFAAKLWPKIRRLNDLIGFRR